MDSLTCQLGMGLILGSLVTALLMQGFSMRKRAMTDIRAPQTERKKVEDKFKEARERRRRGFGNLPAAYMLIGLGLAVLVLAAYLLGGGGFF